MISHGDGLTDESRFFLVPEKPLHRQYEALRAYFVDQLPSQEVAPRFGYTPGTFRVLCSEFRHDAARQQRFFQDVRHGPHAAQRRDAVRDLVIRLRKQNLSVYDIQAELAERGQQISINALSILLHEEGFARLPRRGDEERPARQHPDAAPVADARALDLSPRSFHSGVAGLFLFLPLLQSIDFGALVQAAELPGTEMVPAAHALRTLLALKLLGKERTSHVMELVFDPGIALFAGLNVVPKRSFLAEYSGRVDPRSNLRLMSAWAEVAATAGLGCGASFDLDFHTVPANSEAEPLDKHYVSRRSRSQKGILTFLARDVQENVLCYGNAGVPKDQRDGEVLRFVEFWLARTGRLPEELVFDSQLTTHATLHQLQERGIAFITLRRRSRKLVGSVFSAPAAQWRRVTLPALTRQFRNPRVLDTQVTLPGYPGPLRQLAITDLGHEEPTILLTNRLRASVVDLITRYAQRMLIENGIADAINFFHLDALSSMVGLKVDFDLQMTLMASALYRLMAQRIGREYRRATAKTLFRKLLDVSGDVHITPTAVVVDLARRAHNPFLVSARLTDQPIAVPWLKNMPVVLRFV